MRLADLDLASLAQSVIEQRPDLIDAWLRDQPGSWGALAAQAILTTRRALGRSLTDAERRVVWQVLWDRLIVIRGKAGDRD